MEFKEEFIKATKVFVILTIVAIVIEYTFNSSFTSSDIKEWTITNFCYTYPFYFANGYLNLYMNKVMPWNSDAKRRAILGTIITIGFNVVLIYLVMTFVTVYVYGGPADYAFTSRGRNNMLTSLVIVTMITLIFYSIGFYTEVQSERLTNEKLRKEKISAELNVLKSQVDPHFLFNSFNVLSGLIDEDSASAQKFLSGLSKIYRYVLEHRDEDLALLSDELEFARQYIELQQVRFENGIVLNTHLPELSIAQKIPTLSVQMVLENAIKHNGFSSAEPLIIDLNFADGCLMVSNNKQERKKLASGNGLGLNNIRQRYELYGIERFMVEDAPDFFTVKLPLIG